MWWISYRGESGHGVDNIGVFEDDGSPRKIHPLLLDPSPAAHPLHIARGFALVGDDLYIANAWRKDSHIARYHRHGDTFRFKEVLAKTEQIAAMVHPFDVELGDDGRIYVSCQDTNTVVALRAEDPQTGTGGRAPPQALPQREISSPARSSRPARGAFPSTGTARHSMCRTPLGLKVVLDKRGKPRHSVRGIVVHRKHLYVADEAGDVGEGLQRASPGSWWPASRTTRSKRPCTCCCTVRPSTSAPLAAAAYSHWTCHQPRPGASSRRAW